MRPATSLLVTGGAGFIGSAFIRYLLCNPEFSGKILNYDLLTYAANLESLKGVQQHPRYRFIQADILDQAFVEKLILEHEIDTIVHFAAETHVDRSIHLASSFVRTNVQGTLSLLEALKKFSHVHFHHISTDEVYGSLGESGFFTEHSNYRPNSPYSASKAASDHLVRAFFHTYKISMTMSHCCNNYGPFQHPEKLIPLIIKNCLCNRPLPIYGRGANIRSWIHVDDHAAAVWEILKQGRVGHSYNIGEKTELSNLDLLYKIIEYIQKKRPGDYHSLIRFVKDRPGHDYRYALDISKIKKELKWKPKIPFDNGLMKTIRWYIRCCF